MKVGEKFKLFGKGKPCKIVAISNGKIKFEREGSSITGSIPIESMHTHKKTSAER